MTPEVTEAALDRIVRPTLAEMVRRGTPFQGVLDVGLMTDGRRPAPRQYNVRFGDPEAQVLAMRLGAQFSTSASPPRTVPSPRPAPTSLTTTR